MRRPRGIRVAEEQVRCQPTENLLKIPPADRVSRHAAQRMDRPESALLMKGLDAYSSADPRMTRIRMGTWRHADMRKLPRMALAATHAQRRVTGRGRAKIEFMDLHGEWPAMSHHATAVDGRMTKVARGGQPQLASEPS